MEVLVGLVDVGATGDGGLTGLSADDRADLRGDVGVAWTRGDEGDTRELAAVKLVNNQRLEAVCSDSKQGINRSIGITRTCDRVQIVDPARPSVHQRRRDDEASAIPRRSVYTDLGAK